MEIEQWHTDLEREIRAQAAEAQGVAKVIPALLPLKGVAFRRARKHRGTTHHIKYPPLQEGFVRLQKLLARYLPQGIRTPLNNSIYF